MAGMTKSRAGTLLEFYPETDPELSEDITFNFSGNARTNGGSSTPSTRNVEDHLRAKGYIHGRDFAWDSPYKLTISQDCVDRDLMISIEAAGGQQE